MENKDTICLLQECDAGTKMAVDSIDEILEKIQDENLRKVLTESREEHLKLGDEIHTLLTKHGGMYKDPSFISKGMSFIKTNVKMGLDDSDKTVASLITDGCDMGIKSLQKYLNEYENADHISKGICKKLISIEEKLSKDLREYL
ncbi:MAG: hypothetical protein K1W34_16020 [Lachnospiraceae bacterium]